MQDKDKTESTLLREKREKAEEGKAQEEIREGMEKIEQELPFYPAEVETGIPKAGVERPPSAAPAPSPVPAPLYKSEELVMIEQILEEDLSDVYFGLSPAKRKEFKERGEEAASKIEKLLQATKIKVKKILDLIANWLRLIPGVNRLFLEQEAKIKTDKILAIKKMRK